MSWYCPACGTNSVAGSLDDHECQNDVLIAHQREQFESQIHNYFASKEGRFARYYAERQGDPHT